MYLPFIVIVVVSLALQIAAAVLAARLIRVTGTSRAWIAIATAMLAMAIRRLAVLIGVMHNPDTLDTAEFWSEAIGLFIAVFLFVGIVAIEPLFRTIQKARKSIEQSRDQLQQEVARRTADLVKANELLQVEVARRAEVETALRDEHHHLARVLAIYELDRHLVAYDMHDGFVQPATAAQMNLQAAISNYASNPDNALENIVTGLHQLQQSLAQVRMLIRGLRPVVLEDKGLVAAIEQLVHDTETSSEVDIAWSPCVTFDRLSPALEMSVFRIIQEGLANAVRHSKSNRVTVELKQIDRTIHVKIEDWGSGFDTTVPKAGHFGLESIRERARLFGGAAHIESSPGSGTRIEVELPLIEYSPAPSQP